MSFCCSIDSPSHSQPPGVLLQQGATAMGIPNVPKTLTEGMAEDAEFLAALYHILLHVHLVDGTLTCPTTGREFPVENEIPNMMIDDEDC